MLGAHSHSGFLPPRLQERPRTALSRTGGSARNTVLSDLLKYPQRPVPRGRRARPHAGRAGIAQSWAPEPAGRCPRSSASDKVHGSPFLTLSGNRAPALRQKARVQVGGSNEMDGVGRNGGHGGRGLSTGPPEQGPACPTCKTKGTRQGAKSPHLVRFRPPPKRSQWPLPGRRVPWRWTGGGGGRGPSGEGRSCRLLSGYFT